MSHKIADERKHSFFITDNEIFDCDLNCYQLAIYFYLVRLSGNEKKCFPSLNNIAKKLKISKPTVINSLNTLQNKKIILITKRTIGQEKESNLYTLKNIKNKSEVVNQIDHVVNQIDHGGKPDLPGVVNQVYPINTHITNTHLRIYPDVSGETSIEPKIIKDEDVEEIYFIYPPRDKNNKNRSTNKSYQDKKKIKTLLKKYSKDDFIKIIKNYLIDADSTKSYIQNFKTFLNTMPEINPVKLPDKNDLTPTKVDLYRKIEE